MIRNTGRKRGAVLSGRTGEGKRRGYTVLGVYLDWKSDAVWRGEVGRGGMGTCLWCNVSRVSLVIMDW